MSDPFVEHPTGDFKSALAAMENAVQRLRALPQWTDWITFCAQGAGHDEESDHFAEIRLRRDELEIDTPIDPPSILRKARVSPAALTASGDHYSIAGASPAEAARIFDILFRDYLGIRPHKDQRNDYAVGAEW
jgi:hypothetical protein